MRNNGNNFLLHDNFVALRAVLALSQAGFGTGCCDSLVHNLSMSMLLFHRDILTTNVTDIVLKCVYMLTGGRDLNLAGLVLNSDLFHSVTLGILNGNSSGINGLTGCTTGCLLGGLGSNFSGSSQSILAVFAAGNFSLFHSITGSIPGNGYSSFVDMGSLQNFLTCITDIVRILVLMASCNNDSFLGLILIFADLAVLTLDAGDGHGSGCGVGDGAVLGAGCFLGNLFGIHCNSKLHGAAFELTGSLSLFAGPGSDVAISILGFLPGKLDLDVVLMVVQHELSISLVVNFLLCCCVCFVPVQLSLQCSDQLFVLVSLAQSALVDDVLDSLGVVLLLELSFQTVADLGLEGIGQNANIHFGHDRENVVIVLVLDGVLSHHGVLIVVLLINNAVTVGILVGVHDVGHIEGVVVSQPVVDHQQLLSLGDSAGALDQLHDFVTGSLNVLAVVSNTQLVAVVEVQDHTGQIIHGHVTGADSIHGGTGQGQHFTQNTQAVFSLVVVLQEEGNLQTQSVCILSPVVQVLLIQTQNLLDLLFSQGHRLLGSVIPNLDCLQISFEGNDCGVFCIDLSVGVGQHDLVREVELKLNFVSIDSNVLQDRLHIDGLFLLCFFSMLMCVDIGHAGGNHQAEHHGQCQHHAEETLQILRHSSTPFREQ